MTQSRRKARNGTAARRRGRSGAAGLALLLAAAAVQAQERPAVPGAAFGIFGPASPAPEIPFLLARRGAGGDPQTSVAQPDVTARPSANLTTSIQDLLGPDGDPGGLRRFLAERGISYNVIYFADVFGNAAGGIRRGAVYGGLVDAELNLDLDRLLGWQGASAQVTMYQIHGRGLTRGYVGNLLTVSAIEALPATRLFEAWFEQALFDGKLSLRLGQLAADSEFAISQTGTLFLNSTFGWPNIMAVVLPGGGPIYPLATPAVRAKYAPDRNLSLQVGLFNGDPAGTSRRADAPEPEQLNRTGTNFRTRDPALIIAEAAYAYGLEPGGPEPGTVTLGGWHHFGRFDDLRVDAAGRPLAAPGSGPARAYRGNGGLYAMIDQTLYREPDDPNDGASAFVRVAASPGERNLVDLYLDAGLGYKGLLPGRSDDTVGVAFALSRISRRARGFDTDALLAGTPGPRRSSEAVLEATYQAVLAPGITVQPNVQYVFRPGGGIADPWSADGRRIRNATVFGVQATIRY